MNTSEARKLWAEALESGEYEQANSVLQTERGFCCLGVACVVAEGWGIEVHRHRETDKLVGGDLDEQPAVQQWLGLKSEDGNFVCLNSAMAENMSLSPYDDQYPTTTLVHLNDDGNATFAELAAIIRAEPKGLFHE